MVFSATQLSLIKFERSPCLLTLHWCAEFDVLFHQCLLHNTTTIHAFHITFVSNEPTKQAWWNAYFTITITRTMRSIDWAKQHNKKIDKIDNDWAKQCMKKISNDWARQCTKKISNDWAKKPSNKSSKMMIERENWQWLSKETFQQQELQYDIKDQLCWSKETLQQ